MIIFLWYELQLMTLVGIVFQPSLGLGTLIEKLYLDVRMRGGGGGGKKKKFKNL